MMKYFSWTYVKQNPMMFGLIVIVFGLILLMLMNRRAGSSSSTTVTSGKSDAQVGAEMQMGMAQLGAQTQMQMASLSANVEMARLEASLVANQNSNDTALNLAGLEATLRAAELAANERITNRSTDASLSALDMQLHNAFKMQENNNSFQLDYADLAYSSAMETMKTTAALQATMGAQQLEAFKIGTAATTDMAKQQMFLSVIPTLKKKDRDNALRDALAASSGAVITPSAAPRASSSGSGSGLLKFLSPALAIAA